MRERHLDWSAGHTPALAALNTTGGVLATGMVGSLIDIAPVWGVAAAGVGAAGHLIATAGIGGRARLTHRATCWAGAGGWLAWSLATTPWSIASLTSLACLGVAGYATGRFVSIADDRQQERRHKLMLASRRARTATEWEGRIGRVCGIQGSRVVGVEQWDTGTGYTLDVELPEGGKSWRELAAAAEALAADANLPDGCGVEVVAGISRRVALIRVSTVNVQIKDTPYPSEATPLTINNPIPIGLHRDASEAGLSLRQDTTLLTGQKGGGKTNELQVINAGLVRCVDTVVWHIDLNGGGMSLPWITPWHERGPAGGVPAPAVDWVAATPKEAQKMTAAALRIAKHRKVAYRKLRRDVGDDKLPVSPTVPEIVIVVDECAEVLGERTPHRQVQANLEEIQRIGRAEGVNLVFCGLRATTDVIGSTNILKQARARVSMSVQDPEELNYLFGWSCKATPADIPYPGCGLYLQDTSGNPRPFKGYRLVGAALEDVAVAVAARRPALDEPSREVAGVDYTARWNHDRVSHLFDDEPADQDEQTPPAEQAAPPPAPTATLHDPLAQLAAGAAIFQTGTTSTPDGIDWNDAAAWPVISVPGSVAGEELPELISRLLAACGDADRMHTSALSAALDTTPDTLSRLLPLVGLRALPNAFQQNGQARRGYARADIEAVAERIRSGQLTVPSEVANWSHA
ncbi:hypothetical protein [Actinoalloteichus sp. GBA129-24]|uniref:hypothetical protein n=1 Tax=Actinoalloteichus sp. GBA129-24 TaxID=1612551 RepID=UPI0012F7E3D0|nr:hypothetical protein [Actinoalloteichus sp. GBA129-24]